MPSDFVHLHLHTDYSLLDGACAISWSKLKPEEREGKVDIVTLAKEFEMPAVAITDHGVLGGAVEFQNAFQDTGIKPIVGTETYISPTTRTDRRPEIPHIKGYHLILLAENNEGYENLCRVISEAHTNGFYYKPRVDKEFLAAHSKGLIALSACIQGEVANRILYENYAAARKALQEYVDIFGKENFFLEVMDHGMEEQKKINREFVKLSRESGIPLVATNDVHYLKKEHARPHDLMLCIQTHATYEEARRMRMSSDEFYFKNADEMKLLFQEIPEAVTNTLRIAERCEVKIEYKNHYPVYHVPEGTTQTDMLRELCIKGFPKRYGYDPLHPDKAHEEDAKLKLERMDYELGIIHKTNYDSYFLVVWDFINAAKETGIPVGPGRGSGAGSLVAFLTGITDIDPIRYKLFFERFLNPDRVSPPDFDIDFCERRREEVIQYVTRKYGKDCVSQIGTYGTLKAKNAIKDIARVLGRTPSEGDKITKRIPNDPKMTLAKAIKESSELQELIRQEPWVQEIFNEAKPLEGLNRNMGIHAAGVIICDHPLAGVIPLGRGANNEVITQYTAPLCEEVGLLKMDFLGLRTLTVIDDTLRNIKKSRGIDLDLDKIPLDDPATFQLLNNGDTIAVFQLESGGMQDLCRKFKVESIDHISALLAIYRPGPMEFIPDFVSRKVQGRQIEYDHPLMEPILNETYGIMLYQEQIMQVVQALAGFSLGQADILRRAIGKKKIKDMEYQHAKFVEGCAKTNRIDGKLADQIWEKIKKFAGYGFNKSHSAAYAVISYQTAYLKANYKPEFFAAVLSSELDKADKITFLINACRESGIQILPPDVNRSDVNFTVDNGAIRFGLGAIKGFGQNASQAILEARAREGDFKSLSDLLERTGGVLNTKSSENLIRAGAMDSFGLKRSQLVAIIESSIQSANSRRRDKEMGQGNLFDMLADFEDSGFGDVPPPDIPEFSESEILAREKELLGFYVSGHPIAKYAEYFKAFSTQSVAKITEGAGDVGVRVGGMIKSVARKISKKDNRLFGILQFEDLTASIEVLAYSRTYESCKELIHRDEVNRQTKNEGGSLPDVTPVFVIGLTRKADEASPVSITAEKIIPLDEALEKYSEELHIHLNESSDEPARLKDLLKLIGKHPGTKTRLILCIRTLTGGNVFIEASARYRVKVTQELLQSIQNLFGEKRWRVKTDDTVPSPRAKFERPAWKEAQESESQN